MIFSKISQFVVLINTQAEKWPPKLLKALATQNYDCASQKIVLQPKYYFLQPKNLNTQEIKFWVASWWIQKTAKPYFVMKVISGNHKETCAEYNAEIFFVMKQGIFRYWGLNIESHRIILEKWGFILHANTQKISAKFGSYSFWSWVATQRCLGFAGLRTRLEWREKFHIKSDLKVLSKSLTFTKVSGLYM